VDTVLAITQIIALVCFSILSIILIVVLLRVKTLVIEAQENLREIRARSVPLLDNLEAITSKVRAISESVDEQVEGVREAITSIRGVAEDIVLLERRVQERVEGPVLDTVAYLVAIIKGLRTFIERVRA
jgi:uncharacterized protein YoxC